MEEKSVYFEMYELAEKDPDQCLSRISTIFVKGIDGGLNPTVRFLKGIAYMQKAVNLSPKTSGEKWSDSSLNWVEQSLAEFEAATQSEGLGPEVTSEEIIKKLGSAAIILEKFRPGRVQELLGKTKLKYFGDRISINKECAPQLIPTAEAMNIFGDVFFSFPQIVRSAFVFYMTKDDKQCSYINVLLFEELSAINSSGEMNPFRGSVNIYQGGTFKIDGNLIKIKEEEPKKKAFFKKLFG